MAAVPGSGVQLRTNSRVLVPRTVTNHERNVGVCLRRCEHGRCYSVTQQKQSSVEGSKMFGTRLRVNSGYERLHLWRSDGPGRSPKLRVVARSGGGFSQVPEKPLGLYDPSMDKDSCGVGFVAELSGDCSRKTVSVLFFLILRKFMLICLDIDMIYIDLLCR